MNDRTPSTQASLPLPRRIAAALCIGLVLLLGAASASTALHEWLHTDSAHEAGDQCAVVLFASGITLATAAVVAVFTATVWFESATRVVAEIFLASPRYLRQPERGPPFAE